MFEVDIRFAETLALAGLHTTHSVVQRFARGIPLTGRSATVRPDEIVLPNGRRVSVYYKHYGYLRPAWTFIGRQSKALREFLNYRVFSSLGLHTPETVACGEERTPTGRLRYAFIITRTIPNAVTLPDYWQQLARHPSPEFAVSQRALMIRQLAEQTRKLHEARFFHNDLLWRNLLVTREDSGHPVLWWIDCPRGRFDRHTPFWHHRRIKDLALLDKAAAAFYTRQERLTFLRIYLGGSANDSKIDRLAAAVARYARHRHVHRDGP